MAGVSPEYKTMIACTGKLVSNIEANSPAVIAHKLQAEWLLARDVYKKLDLPIKDDADRARDIVRNVTDKVYANHKVQFPKFVAVLRNCEGLGDLLQTIEKIFVEKGGDITTIKESGQDKGTDPSSSVKGQSISTLPKITSRCGTDQSTTKEKEQRKGTEVRVSADSGKTDESTRKSSDDDDDDGTVPPAKKHCPVKKIIKSDHKFKPWSTDSEEYFGLDLSLIHDKGIDGTGTKIAIIDVSHAQEPTGIQVTHEALRSKYERNEIEVKKVADGDDSEGHALVCTSIAVGKAFTDGLRVDCNEEKNIDLPYPGGVAPGAKATVFLVDMGDINSIKQALDSVCHGDYHVLSMSFGFLDVINEIEDRLERLKDKTIIVAAAGNSGNNVPVSYPARHPGVISVGALDVNFKPSGFSAENKDVDTYYCGEVLAPCSDSTKRMLKISTGTSMATPGIAGLVCLLMQCAKKHGYEAQMKKKENMMKVLNKVVYKETPTGKIINNLRFLLKAYKEKETLDNLLA